MTPSQSESAPPTPILLLKTASSPTDAYADLFSASSFAPTFIPVLQHSFTSSGLETVRKLLRNRRIRRDPDADYGGFIFTSQRAVEALAALVDEDPSPSSPLDLATDSNSPESSWPHLHDVPFYSVGPATTRALAAVRSSPPLQIFGSHTGSGAALAPYILSHYPTWYPSISSPDSLPPLLFLVGEQRRDIIPRSLTNAGVRLTETVVYGTTAMPTLSATLASALSDTAASSARWLVVFSPTGCDTVLRELGLLDEGTGRVSASSARDGKTFIATIGPTTRDHLRTFGFEPDVCAETPTPEGVLKGIREFVPRQPS